MGQRASRTNGSGISAFDGLNLSVFPTELGWIGLLGQGDRLFCLTVGHETEDKVRQDVLQRLESLVDDSAGDIFPEERDWFPSLRKRLERYCAGKLEEFDDIALQLPPQTPFQQTVLARTRKIRYGRALTYGELAQKAGYPRAARAVGTVMSSNRFPIVVPCHRVVQSGGKIGNYTSPRGSELKEQLLAMEAGAAR